MLYFGDCLSVIKEFDLKPDHIITDAPYDLDCFPLAFFRSICKGNIITFCRPENQFFVPDEYGFWLKAKSPKNNTTRLTRNVEMILISRGVGKFHTLPYPNTGNYWDDILETPALYEHQKPLSLMERLVRMYSEKGCYVLDPYAGVGTTGKACQRTNRQSMLIEKDQKRFELALHRMAGEIE